MAPPPAPAGGPPAPPAPPADGRLLPGMQGDAVRALQNVADRAPVYRIGGRNQVTPLPPEPTTPEPPPAPAPS